MSNWTLLISSPPHGAVDVRAAAPILDLIPVEVNLKVHYPIPEIWLADEDPARMAAAADALRAAGVNLVSVTGDQLVNIPAQRLVHSLDVAPDVVIAVTSHARVAITPADNVFVVVSTSRPPEEGAATIGEQTVEGLQISELAPFFDIYVEREYGADRLTIFGDVVDFGIMGEQRGPSNARNLQQLAKLLEEQQPTWQFDRRLVNLQLRRKYRASSQPLRENRRGYSYASRGFTELLASIAPSWAEPAQAEFTSRLVYLTRPVTRE